MDQHQARGRSPAGTLQPTQNKSPSSRSPSQRSSHEQSSSTVDPSLLQPTSSPTQASAPAPNLSTSPFGNIDTSNFDTTGSDQPYDFGAQQPFASQPPVDTSDYQAHSGTFDSQLASTHFDASTTFSDLNNQIDLLPDEALGFTDSTFFNGSGQSQQINPAELDTMAAMHSHAPQAPHFLSQGMQHGSAGSSHSTPSMQQNNFDGCFQADNRRTSLDPSSAYRQNDWSAAQFQTIQHRRSHSDARSDISSNYASPNLPDADSFDPILHSNSHSPLFPPQQDPTLASIGLDQFTLNDVQKRQLNMYSPGHSSHPSPNLQDQQQSLPQFAPDSSFEMLNGSSDFEGQMIDSNMMFGQPAQESFPLVSPHIGPTSPPLNEEGTMSPPEINVEFAPDRPLLHSDHRLNSHEGLTPPGRSPCRLHLCMTSDADVKSGHSRPRGRATSESYVSKSPSRSASPMRPRSPSLGVPLNPLHTASSSRSPSPGITAPSQGNGVVKQRRQSRGQSPDRARVLALADLNRNESADPSQNQFTDPLTASTGSDTNRKVQKHPATFQCSLCPKRFTRAYNLRSHLRTHTDERPFVCAVCGKAFARQHDRKRHESLHSGEKRFVCRGTCTGPSAEPMQWGCGRRFARADALGRHFRSEAGRACIKPLMDEEARERQADQFEQANHEFMITGAQMNNNGSNMAPQQAMASQQMPSFNGMPLPAALLAQYPALAEIQWSQMPGPGQSVGADDDYDHSPRSSFEASDYYEEGEEDDYGSGDTNNWDGSPGMTNQHQQHQQHISQGQYM